jgi:hypothetical protein
MLSRKNHSGLLNLEEEGRTDPQIIRNHSPSDTVTSQKILIFFPRHVCVVYCDYEPYLVILFVSMAARLVLESAEREEEDGEDDLVVCNVTSTSGVHTDHNTNGEPDSG